MTVQRILPPVGARLSYSTLWSVIVLTLSLVLIDGVSVFAGNSRDSLKTRSAKKTESASGSQEISWQKYEDGIKLAKEQDKQILIDFSTAWCGYCKKMDRETFKNAQVIDFINSNFVAIRVDGDSKREFEIDGFSTTEKRLTSEMFGVRGYPTFWFLEADGSKIGKQPGYQPASGFLELLAFVNDKKYLEQDESSGDNQSK